MRKLLGVIAVGVMIAGSASAAPVLRPAALILGVAIQGLAPITIAAVGAVTVDSTAGNMGMGKISIAAGAVTLPVTIVVPVTASTAVASITAKTLSNLSGMFSLAGAAIGGTETPCPASLGGKPGEACVVQTGIGGVMGLTGTIAVHVIPNIVVIPVNLNAALLGQGGYTSQPFTIDAAPWTRKTAQVAVGGTSPTTVTFSGTTNAVASSFTLVTPTFVLALGNLLPIVGSITVAFLDAGGLPVFINKMLPEPGTLLLLGSGVAGLALLGRRRRS